MLLWNWFGKNDADKPDEVMEEVNEVVNDDFIIFSPDILENDKENQHRRSPAQTVEVLTENASLQYDFDPTDQDFAEAKADLNDKPDGAKFAKKGSMRKYSFIKSDGEVIAMSNGACFKYKGGAYGLFKIGKTEERILVGIKIEPRKLRSLDDPGYIAAVRMGLTYSQAQRSDPGMRFQLRSEAKKGEPKKIVEDKLYTIMRLGETDLLALFNNEFQNRALISELQKELIRLKTAYQIMIAHSYGIIHRDLKPENIVVNMQDNNIEVGLIDLDSAAVLGPDEQEQIAEEIGGNFEYLAPECMNLIYTTASDVYALGIMFLLDFNIKPLFEQFSDKLDGSQREMGFDYLIEHLAKHQQLDIERFIAEFELDQTPHLDLIKKMIAYESAYRISASEVVYTLCERLLNHNEVKKDMKLVMEISEIKQQADHLMQKKSNKKLPRLTAQC